MRQLQWSWKMKVDRFNFNLILQGILSVLRPEQTDIWQNLIGG